MFDFFRKLLGQSNEAEIKKLQKIVAKINTVFLNVSVVIILSTSLIQLFLNLLLK